MSEDGGSDTGSSRVAVLDSEDTQQLNLGSVPKTLVRAFRRLADLKGKTLSQWAIDELEAAVLRERDETKRYYETAAERAREEQLEHEQLVDELATKLGQHGMQGRTKRSGRRPST